MAKTGLVLIFTLAFSVFMYQGLYRPGQSQAAIGTVTAWTLAGTSGTNNHLGNVTTATQPVTIAAGAHRVLIVAVAYQNKPASGSTNPGCEVRYNTQLMNLATATSASQNHTFLFYMVEQGNAAQFDGTAHNLQTTMTGTPGNGQVLDVYYTVLSGVDQTNPLGSAANNTANWNSIGGINASFLPLGHGLTINANEQAVIAYSVAQTVSATIPTLTFPSYISGTNTGGWATIPGHRSYVGAWNAIPATNQPDSWVTTQTSAPANVTSLSAMSMRAWTDQSLISSCGTCHGYPPVDSAARLVYGTIGQFRGSHNKHSGSAAGQYAYTCDKCHPAWTTMGHESGTIQMTSIGYSKGISWSQTNNPTAFGACSSLYCHSQGVGATGQAGDTRSLSTPLTTLIWATQSSSCTSCHAAPPSYANWAATWGAPKANSHWATAHSPLSCNVCHYSVTSDGATITTPSNHDNGVYNIAGVAGGLNQSMSYTYAVDGGKCNNSYCHSSGQGLDGASAPVYGTPGWGSSGSVMYWSSSGNYTCSNSCHATVWNSSGRHRDHTAPVAAGGYNLACSLCHKGAGAWSTLHVNSLIDIVFDATIGGSYSQGAQSTPQNGFGTCGSIYCHSAGSNVNYPFTTPNTTANWSTTLPSNCTGCHNNDAASGAAMASGSHAKHVDTSGLDLAVVDCSNCHSATVSDSRTITNQANHANRQTNIQFKGWNTPGTFNGASTPTWSTPGPGYGSCGTIYCHSSAQGINGVSAPTYGSPVWSSSTSVTAWTSQAGGSCVNTCHNAAWGTMLSSGSHNKHLSNGYGCGTCHYQRGAWSTYHVNHVIDLNLDSSVGGSYSLGNHNPQSGFGSCSGMTCHGTGVWGSSGSVSTFACFSCHIAVSDVDDFDAGWGTSLHTNGVQTKISQLEWQTVGHGKWSTYPVSNNPGAGFTDSNDCEFCHDKTTDHRIASDGTQSNPFRLRNISTVNSAGSGLWITWGLNGACQSCHATGSAGVWYTALNQGVWYSNKSRNATRKIDSYHWGTDHQANNTTGGRFCWDCHDPHGDSNIFMVRNNVTKANNANGMPTAWSSAVTFTNNATGTDYANNSGTGLCNVCHQYTAHYKWNTGDSHNSSSACTSCHKHTYWFTTGVYSARDGGFAPQGGDCLGCHSTSQGNARAVITGAAGQFSANSHHVQGISVTTTICYRCHWEADQTGGINGSYHPQTANAPVALVIWNTTTRPTTWITNVTAIQYWASVADAQEHTERAKLNAVCLGCHSDINKNTDIFGDGKRPAIYAWDSSSIDARYSQSGWTTWGKYSGLNVTPKNTVIKAFSAHGWPTVNDRGWDTIESWPDTSGTVQVVCNDCHNSHGSWVTGATSYNSATTSGGLIKNTQQGVAGDSVSYKPVSRGTVNAYKPTLQAGAVLCLDCHQNASPGTTQPWGYSSTYGATQPIIGYDDKLDWATDSAISGRKMRSDYKKADAVAGSHFKASSTMGYTPTALGGICTKCHDPHGVSQTDVGTCSDGFNVTRSTCLAAGQTWTANQSYGVPLLKGTYLTSPYKEDAAPLMTNVSKGGGSTTKGWQSSSHPGYNIDQNTFDTLQRGTIANAWTSARGASASSGWWASVTDQRVLGITTISQSANVFGGLCLQCHPKSQIWSTNGSWGTTIRIHNSVKGWAKSWGSNMNNSMHGYVCSKCHTPHASGLPRLMITNCLDWNHRGQKVSGGPAPIGRETVGGSGAGSGRFPRGGGGFAGSTRAWIAAGTGSGYEFGYPGPNRTTAVVRTSRPACHEGNWNTTDALWQKWNMKTQW